MTYNKRGRKRISLDEEVETNAMVIKLDEAISKLAKMSEEMNAKDLIILKLHATINERDTTIQSKDATIIEKDATIARLIFAAGQNQNVPPPSTDEEKDHRRSIVVSNMPEHPNQVSAADRYYQDECDIKALLNQLDVECDVKEVFRMGKRSSKPRLLKVRLQTGAQAKAAIANAKYIRNTDFHDFGIHIRQSMNDEERRQERERTKAQQEKIEQLKLQYPGKKFVIYAREICLSNGYRRDGRKNRPTIFIEEEEQKQIPESQDDLMNSDGSVNISQSSFQ